MDKNEIIQFLRCCENDSDLVGLQRQSEEVTLRQVGNAIHFRGLIEFSNLCTRDCFYCGIRKSNTHAMRYTLTPEEIIEIARWSALQGYGSIALQSGERQDAVFIEFVIGILRKIKAATTSPTLPHGVGITLSVGEQSRETYQRFFDAGAHRYLLRIEASNPSLFRQIHPPEQSFEVRRRCLTYLREIGYQVGTGVMIGLPGQSYEDLADDILFFRDMDVDMIGMGPYLVHHQTPMNRYLAENERNRILIYKKSLAMIAATRIVLPKVNIASTTALQTIAPGGRLQGLRFGANVLMPQTTPPCFRRNYLLYEGKPSMDENAAEIRDALERDIHSIGRIIPKNTWGDSLYFHEKNSRK